MSGGAVDTDEARAARSLQCVSLDAAAAGDIPDVYMLVRQDVRGLEEVRADGHAALVVEVRVGYRCPVNL